MSASQKLTDDQQNRPATAWQETYRSTLTDGVLVPIGPRTAFSPRRMFTLKATGGWFTSISGRFEKFFLRGFSAENEVKPSGAVHMGHYVTLKQITTNEMLSLFGNGIDGVPLSISTLGHLLSLIEIDATSYSQGGSPILDRKQGGVNAFIVPQEIQLSVPQPRPGTKSRVFLTEEGGKKSSTHCSKLIFGQYGKHFILREVTLIWDKDHCCWKIDAHEIKERSDPWVTGTRLWCKDPLIPSNHAEANFPVKTGKRDRDNTGPGQQQQPRPRLLPDGYPAGSL